MRALGFNTKFLALVLTVPAVLYFAVQGYFNHFAPLPVFPGRANETVSESVAFTTQSGTPYRLDTALHGITVVNFFFTHCPAICYRMMTRERDGLSATAAGGRCRLVSFTVDPEHDDAKTLNAYAKRLSLDTGYWTLLTGEKKSIYLLARNRFNLMATEGDGGPGDFIHSDRLVLLDKAGEIRGYYEGTDSVQVKKLSNDIQKLYDEK